MLSSSTKKHKIELQSEDKECNEIIFSGKFGVANWKSFKVKIVTGLSQE